MSRFSPGMECNADHHQSLLSIRFNCYISYLYTAGTICLIILDLASYAAKV
ncbi:unnamed protein product [Brassica oleracea var. botrytis]|uniref:Uncharacterized protein n=2 Tax=Brassica TaxID=3705 RepID=A0A3P6CG80_BRAOL|nr:unnamed protein product [Brassica napus]CDY15042.1 BnaCnng04450D [Brassica napus]VDD08841.1 unnamed protein product [Brassica oleracea]